MASGAVSVQGLFSFLSDILTGILLLLWYLLVACAGCTSLAITLQPWIPNIDFHDLVKNALLGSAAASPIFFGILTCPYIASQELAVRGKTTFADAYRITAETLVTVTAAGVVIAHGYFIFCKFLRSFKPTDAVTEPLQPQDLESNFQATPFAAQDSTAGSATDIVTQDPDVVRAEAEEVTEPERQVHEGPAIRANQDYAALNDEFRKQSLMSTQNKQTPIAAVVTGSATMVSAPAANSSEKYAT